MRTSPARASSGSGVRSTSPGRPLAAGAARLGEIRSTRVIDEGAGVDEKDILGRISALVDEEHQLRGSSGQHTDDERTRLSEVEAHLDQRWDLLRQWRAKRQ